jgi:hypothetical protein
LPLAVWLRRGFVLFSLSFAFICNGFSFICFKKNKKINAGTVHEGTPSSDFSIFDPYMLFLAFFFAKLESTTLILSRGPYSGQSVTGKGEFDF